MQAVKIYLILIGLLFSFSSSVAKNKVDGELLSKKDEIGEKLDSRLRSNDALFEKNNGQYEGDFQFRFTSRTACVDFFNDKITFSLRKVSKDFNPQKLEEPMEFEYVNWEIKLENSICEVIKAKGPLQSTKVNYFSSEGKYIGKEMARAIVYPNVYPLIDLVFYKSEDGELKYDFILKPGSKLSDISLEYTGVESLACDDFGNLTYDTKWGVIQEKVPYSYVQESKNEVNIAYEVNGNSLSFQADFDVVSETIVLDPIYVDWSSYFYGTGNSGTTYSYTWVYDLDIDDDHNLYVAGITNDKFPGLTNSYDTSTNGYYDAFVCKMAPDGDSIIWFSYLGGDNYEYCFSIAVNSKQEPVVSGFTRSDDFPTTMGAFDQTADFGVTGFYYAGFVSKFSKDGKSLLFSTFLGGTGSDLIQSLIIDENDNIYLAGQTNSSDFPVTTGCYQSTYGGGSGTWWNSGDAFLTKMKPDGSDLLFSTYLGGFGDDVAYQVALSPANDIYMVGKTTSYNFPVTPGSRIFNNAVIGASDGFIVKFNNTGTSLGYSKLMGGSGADWFEGVYVNERNEAYVAGISESGNFYTSNNAYQKSSNGGADAVVVKFNPGGQNVYYSTYLGGSSDEKYYSGWIYNSNVRIAANVREEPIICGITRSNDFPVTTDALFKNNPSAVASGWWNTAATITKLDHKGEKQLYGTYYGGSSYEVPGANKLKRISCYTNILYGGFTASSDYPTTTGVYKETKGAGGTGFYWTGFISKFRDTLYTDDIELSLQDTITMCDRVFDVLDAKNIGADILWSNGGTESYNIVQDTGTYWVQATYGCDTARDTIRYELDYSPQLPILPKDSVYCDVYPRIVLDASVDSVEATYEWSTGETSDTIVAGVAQEYWVDVITENCGTKRDYVVFDYKLKPQPIFSDSVFCDSVDIVLVAGDSIGNEEKYIWNDGDTASTKRFTDEGVYQVVVSNVCGEDSASVYFSKIYTPNIELPLDSEFCDNVSILLEYGLENNEENYTITDVVSRNYFQTKIDSFKVDKIGHYEISINNRCGIAVDSFLASVINSPKISLGADSIFCDNLSYPMNIGTNSNKETYLWDDGTTSNSRTFINPGIYWAQIDNKCDIVRDTVEIELKHSPTVNLPQDSVFCDGISYVLDADIAEPSDYLWNTGSTDSAILVSSTGKYHVTISNHCGTVQDSITLGLITTPRVELGGDSVFCGGVSPLTYTVGKQNNEEVYLWSNGHTGNSTSFTTLGKHWVMLSNKCGTDSDTVEYKVSEYPTVDLGPDTTLCGNFSLTLDAGNPGMTYVWEPFDENTQTIQATEQRVYKVTVINDNGCEGSDEMEVKPDCISKSFIPSGFTPNGDGLNDVFRPTLINYESYTLKVYNRWGEKIYEGHNAEEGWDGTYQGKIVPNGVYTYVMQYKTTEDLQWQNIGGVLNVIR